MLSFAEDAKKQHTGCLPVCSLAPRRLVVTFFLSFFYLHRPPGPPANLSLWLERSRRLGVASTTPASGEESICRETTASHPAGRGIGCCMRRSPRCQTEAAPGLLPSLLHGLKGGAKLMLARLFLSHILRLAGYTGLYGVHKSILSETTRALARNGVIRNL